MYAVRQLMADTAQEHPEAQAKSLAEFLEGSPPDVQETISDLAQRSGPNFILQQPEIQIHCNSERCNGLRVFHQTSGSAYVELGKWSFKFVTYTCRNCERNQKVYALATRLGPNGQSGLAQKLGEIPSFSPSTPAHVITLIGPDRDIFLRGRRAENHGLGIGAFAYYRRVVENQKGRIITSLPRDSAA